MVLRSRFGSIIEDGALRLALRRRTKRNARIAKRARATRETTTPAITLGATLAFLVPPPPPAAPPEVVLVMTGPGVRVSTPGRLLNPDGLLVLDPVGLLCPSGVLVSPVGLVVFVGLVDPVGLVSPARRVVVVGLVNPAGLVVWAAGPLGVDSGESVQRLEAFLDDRPGRYTY